MSEEKNRDNTFQKELYWQKRYYKELERRKKLEQKTISKNKIKAKIKELEELKQGSVTLSNDYWLLLGGIKHLEELLGE